MVSFITPPVALGAFAAATLAGARPMETGLTAMKLGGVIYIAPFFFVLNPALVGEAPAWEVLVVFVTAILGIGFISMALQGYVSLLGSLGNGVTGLASRLLLFTAGLFFAAPANDLIGLSHLELSGIGLALALGPLLMARARGRTEMAVG
jgi:TRAP-type uncharacterized transport system fused permease subunit